MTTHVHSTFSSDLKQLLLLLLDSHACTPSSKTWIWNPQGGLWDPRTLHTAVSLQDAGAHAISHWTTLLANRCIGSLDRNTWTSVLVKTMVLQNFRETGEGYMVLHQQPHATHWSCASSHLPSRLFCITSSDILWPRLWLQPQLSPRAIRTWSFLTFCDPSDVTQSDETKHTCLPMYLQYMQTQDESRQ